MSYQGFIIRDPAIMLGKPTLKGTRITVEHILDKLSQGFTIGDILEAYPHLSHQQVVAAIECAAAIIANEEIMEIK